MSYLDDFDTSDGDEFSDTLSRGHSLAPIAAIAAAALVSGVIGVLVVRAIFLDPVEELGWHFFWEGLSKGETMRTSALLESTTLWKCVSGFVVAAVAGGVGSWLVVSKGKPGGKPRADWMDIDELE